MCTDVYTIEFQKSGLLHDHVLLFLDSSSKFPNPKDIDRIICAGIPDQFDHPKLLRDSWFMAHIMQIICFHHAWKKVVVQSSKSCASLTTIDAKGYPIYRRRKIGCYIEKGNIALNNHYVVPYNPFLLMKYQAHMNVEWCNQSKAIKYLSNT